MKKAYAALGAAAVLLGATGTALAQTTQENVINGSNPHFADPETVAKVREADTHRLKGQELLKQGKADAALAEFNKAREIRPEAGVETYMAEAYALKGQNAKAVEWYRKVIYPPLNQYISQTNSVDLMRYAIVLNRTHQRQEAVSIYNRAMQYLPLNAPQYKDNAPINIAFPTPQYDARLFEAAARVALAVTQLSFDPTSKEALAQLDEAIRLQPRLGIAHFYRADILSRDPEKAAEAVTEFSKALRFGQDLRPFVANSLKQAPTELQAMAAKSLK